MSQHCLTGAASAIDVGAVVCPDEVVSVVDSPTTACTAVPNKAAASSVTLVAVSVIAEVNCSTVVGCVCSELMAKKLYDTEGGLLQKLSCSGKLWLLVFGRRNARKGKSWTPEELDIFHRKATCSYGRTTLPSIRALITISWLGPFDALLASSSLFRVAYSNYHDDSSFKHRARSIESEFVQDLTGVERCEGKRHK